MHDLAAGRVEVLNHIENTRHPSSPFSVSELCTMSDLWFRQTVACRNTVTAAQNPGEALHRWNPQDDILSLAEGIVHPLKRIQQLAARLGQFLIRLGCGHSINQRLHYARAV